MFDQISRGALAAALLAAAPVAALAQTTTASETASAAPASNPLEALVVSASPSGQPIATNLLGASVTLIDPVDMEARQTRIVSDLLRDVPGVAVNRGGPVGSLTQVRIRGAEGNHTLVLIDGIYASDPSQGEFDFASLYADEGARVEVLRGQQPIYGSNAIGGVIQYITPTGKEAPGLSARVEGGSFGTAQGSAHFGAVYGPVDISLSGGYYTTDGTPGSRFGIRDLDAKNNTFDGKLIFTPVDHLRITAVGRYAETYADTDPSDYSSAPTAPTYGLPVDGTDYYYNRQRMGLIRGEYDLFDGHWTQGISVQGNATMRRSFNGIAQPSSFSDAWRARYAYDSTFKFDTGDFHHTLTGAADLEHDTYRNVPLTAVATPQNAREHINNTGFTGQYDLDWKGKAALSGAVRRDDNTNFANATTYRVQGSYLFDTGTRVRAAAGSGITNPTFTELYGFDPRTFIGNANLKPERSHGWEVGLDQTLLDDQLKFAATYFNSRLTDEIYTVFTPTFVSTPANQTTQSKQQGVELSATARVGKQWRVDAAYTYLDATQNGVKEIRRPDNIASLEVAWRTRDDRAGAGVSVRYNGEMTDSYFGARTITETLPAFTLVNFDVDFKINSHLQLYGRVENALDKHYEEVFGFPSPGRAAYVGIRAAL